MNAFVKFLYYNVDDNDDDNDDDHDDDDDDDDTFPLTSSLFLFVFYSF